MRILLEEEGIDEGISRFAGADSVDTAALWKYRSERHPGIIPERL